MKILINNEIDRKEWHKIMANSPYSSPFQTPEYFDFFNSIKEFSSDVFAISELGELSALVVVTIQKESGIKAFFSRRAIVYGGPLFIPGKHEAAELLFRYIVNYLSKKVIYIETRNFFDFSEFKTAFTNVGFNYKPWLNFHLNTSDKNKMMSLISSSRIRQIKKAVKNGAYWSEASSVDEVRQFYNILDDLYKEKIRKPLLPMSFFLEFFNQQIGKYLLVRFNDRIIGGIMCPVMKNKSIYEFYICGLDHEYKDQYPSVMATWAAMEYAVDNNIPLFDFMGAGSPAEAYGVREFKARFGGELVEHGRFIKVLKPTLYRIGILGLSMLSKLKK